LSEAKNLRILQCAMTAPSTPVASRPGKPASKPASKPAGKPISDPADPDPQAKAALAWAHGARFVTTSSQLDQLPAHDLPEIAFVGRSNAGKSTAINTLTQQRQLAFASRTPGRTQHINLFALGPKETAQALLADLPGYGYAAVARDAKLRWQQVMADYLAYRRNLAGVVLLVDARHGFTDLDQRALAFIAPRVRTGQIKLLVLLTKADKLNRKQSQQALRDAQAVLGEVATDESDVGVLLFSGVSRMGVGDLAVTVRTWAATPGAPAAEPA
jgi:GTP-binding protein